MNYFYIRFLFPFFISLRPNEHVEYTDFHIEHLQSQFLEYFETYIVYFHVHIG